MSAKGSCYGWVFPSYLSRDGIILEIYEVLKSLGFSPSMGLNTVSLSDSSGLVRHFRFFDHPARRRGPSVVVNNTSKVLFHPYDLMDNPSCWEATQAEYELVKRVFDLTSASEAFGCDDSQGNAYAFEDSNMDFFFLKIGPQLVLRHLEENRMLLPGEEELHSQYQEGYISRDVWDRILKSDYFSRFSDDCDGRIIRYYNEINSLILLPWEFYFRGREKK